MKQDRRTFLATGVLALPGLSMQAAHSDDHPLAGLLVEARFSLAAGEPQRALDLCWDWSQESGNTPLTLQDVENTDVLEMTDKALDQLAAYHVEWQRWEEVVEADPDDGKAHFHLARCLSAIGLRNEALAEYHTAWQNRSAMCACYRRDCLNNIGWCHYRGRQYDKALTWFERARNVDACLPYKLALENLLLTYAALGEPREAWRTALWYVRCHGRIPEYERLALARVGIDADKIYADCVTMGNREGSPSC